MKRRRFCRPAALPWIGLAAAFMATTAATAPQGRPLIGFTFTHLSAHCPDSEKGAAEGARSAGVVASENVMLNYGTEAVRTSAKHTLAAMRAQGAEVIRTILWLHLGPATAETKGPNVLGLLPAPEGKLAPELLQHIAAYTADVREAGYQWLFLPVSSQRQGTPKCRRRDWGDCFDSATMPLTFAAIEQIQQTVEPLRTANFHVVLDIAPETCPETTSRAPIHQTMSAYAVFMTQHFAPVFGGGFIISCGAGPTAGVAEQRIRSLVDLYKAEGLRPLALDVHIYDQPAEETRKTLLMMEAQAERLGTPFFILETYVDHQNLFEQVKALRDRAQLGSLKILSTFPLQQAAHCQESLTAPFSIDALRKAAQ